MENEQLPGDEISQEASQLNQEIGREEGQGSWNELEREEEVDHSGEIESVLPDETSGVSHGPDPIGELGAPGEPGHPEESNQEEEEETEQKNTLSDSSPRVLSFKDFFGKN